MMKNDQSRGYGQTGAQQAKVLLIASAHVLPHQRLDVIQDLPIILHQLVLVALARLDLPLQDLRHLVPQPQ